MTDQDARVVVLDALAYAGVLDGWPAERREAFLQGREDVALSSLGLDSLMVMELCIVLETNTGVSIVPEEVLRHDSLDAVVARLRAGA